MASYRKYVRKVKPLKAILTLLRAYRSFCYFQARLLGDIIAILSGPGAFFRRKIRSKGLTFTSSWSKHI